MSNDYDDDVIFCEDVPTQPTMMDTVDVPEPSRGIKRQNCEIIEILDSDEEEENSPEVPMTVDEVMTKQIQTIINDIKARFGEGSEVHVSSVSPAPWQNLRQILEISSRENQDFFAVRALIVESGVIKLTLNCLSVYTHHFPEAVTVPEKPEPSTSKAGTKRKAPARKYHRWNRAPAKDNGTGFGSGATNSSWNAEQAMNKQIGEEKHVTALLQILASYINPQDEIPSDALALPIPFVALLEQSCLVPVLRSYMRNDSVLDMTQHIPLYRAITLLIRAISTCNQLVHLLMLKQDENDEPIAELLGKIKTCTDTYKSRLK